MSTQGAPALARIIAVLAALIAGWSVLLGGQPASGGFWGGFDADYEFMGSDIMGVIDGLLVAPGALRLDRRVAD